ncbi:hypothetical protein E9993_05005 [Labilibacter sediminis]|nr:hypothetical protein E9993_05005 [Labilibacter sediminis]
MLKHQKAVLNGVRNNRNLFKKELIKSLHWMSNSELSQFVKWVKTNFYREYAELINDVLNQYPALSK